MPHRVVGGKPQVFQFQAQFVHPEPVCDGCVNIQRFLGDAAAAMRSHDP